MTTEQLKVPTPVEAETYVRTDFDEVNLQI
jgi:hypothetical protein